MQDFFNHSGYLNDLKEELGLNENDINNIFNEFKDYAQNIYVIPITIWAEPTPYSPLRVNHATGHVYVPNKAKLVKHIRDLIVSEIGLTNFTNGFFPVFQETIVKTSLYLPTPNHFSKKCKFLAEMKVLRPISKPDSDNILKILFDSIKDFLIYDDAQIVSEITEKYYSTKPRMEVEIIYNASPLLPIHKKIMDSRTQRWQENMLSEKPPAIVPILRKSGKLSNT
jgi:Holliday junction resolvase RusA-like endonuclease